MDFSRITKAWGAALMLLLFVRCGFWRAHVPAVVDVAFLGAASILIVLLLGDRRTVLCKSVFLVAFVAAIYARTTLFHWYQGHARFHDACSFAFFTWGSFVLTTFPQAARKFPTWLEERDSVLRRSPGNEVFAAYVQDSQGHPLKFQLLALAIIVLAAAAGALAANWSSSLVGMLFIAGYFWASLPGIGVIGHGRFTLSKALCSAAVRKQWQAKEACAGYRVASEAIYFEHRSDVWSWSYVYGAFGFFAPLLFLMILAKHPIVFLAGLPIVIWYMKICFDYGVLMGMEYARYRLEDLHRKFIEKYLVTPHNVYFAPFLLVLVQIPGFLFSIPPVRKLLPESFEAIGLLLAVYLIFGGSAIALRVGIRDRKKNLPSEIAKALDAAEQELERNAYWAPSATVESAAT